MKLLDKDIYLIQLQDGISVKVQSMPSPFHLMVLTWQLSGETVIFSVK
jgi:hypothetical protein